MTCEEALLLISGHIDNENTPEEEAQLQLHLAQCDQCRQVLQAFLEIDSGIAALEAEPPAMLHERIMEAVRAEAPVKKRKQSFRWAGLAVAAALVVVIGMASMPQFQKKEADMAAPMLARSMPETTEQVAAYSAQMPDETQNVAADVMQDAVSAAEHTPQSIADARQADVAVTTELLPEMEICPCETLESGALLYQLQNTDDAVNLSRIYGVELFQPTSGVAEASYALLLPHN